LFVAQDVLRSVAPYRDVLGSGTAFTDGRPTFYAGGTKERFPTQ
jgi:hypothetical protein